MFGRELADVYEVIYRSRGKDWAAEAEHVARMVRTRFGEADSLLDVGCGTGLHLARLSRLFARAEGLELSAAMRDRAVQRLPGVPVHAGDMRDFQLDRTFDAVCCMFTAIAYVGGLADMRNAVGAMARHLVPGGVIVIDPWWFPDRFIEGYVAGDLVRDNGRTIARISHSTCQNGVTRLEARFTVADRTGIREFTEVDLLTLFTLEEYLGALDDAGCTARYLPDGSPELGPFATTGRGLFVGQRR
ncbi:class I SAM-dependent methyltransferase [Micromonospora sp. NPDC049559]|uniref:class I SAM-dependent methyltransferase n=1 Tax=Micromonospora sp. NPDC049559 TaxID=3155923 RepID=UPI00342AF0AC